MKVTEYIKKNWPLCIRENKEDDGSLIGLPYPYTVPSIAGSFQEMYYWDTYFINYGLIMIGLTEQAINNTENMFSLIERYGFMPNGNRTHYLYNTQPPFLSMMVKDIYEKTQDKQWLKRAVGYLIKEYSYWEKERATETGLCQYRGDFERAIQNSSYKYFIKRIKNRPEGYSDAHLSIECKISCESGWDMNPRFGFDAQNFVQVELNSLLCAMENNIADFLKETGLDGYEEWKAKADNRLKLMNKYMLCNGYLNDYNFKENYVSNVFSCASFYPMWLGLLTEEQAKATVAELYRLEAPYGLFATEKLDIGNYSFQWGYPNGWAPLHFIVIAALKRYGYDAKAKEIAAKYVAVVERSFDETGTLWEKYNVLEGNINVMQETDHSAMPPMLGWSAGVYLYAKAVAEDTEKS